MRIFVLLFGLVAAAAASLFFLDVLQLIWGQSELSYYLQLSVAGSLLVGVFFAARSASPKAVLLTAIATACLVASMPVETGVWAFTSWGGAQRWMVHGVLIGAFAFGARAWWINAMRPAVKPG